MNPKEIVRSGYDKVSHAYRAADFDYAHSGYALCLAWLAPLLAPGAAVLDLGCGCGVPVAQELSRQGHAITGVDLSPVQIERARELVPAADFLCADMTALEFPPQRFDAIVAFYSIIHVPLAEQPELFSRLARWLKPGGYLLATVGHTAWTGTEPDWLDVPGGAMYWSHADPATYRAWFAANGLRIMREGFLPEDDGGHTVLLGRKEGTS